MPLSLRQPQYLPSHRYSLPLPLFFYFPVIQEYAKEVDTTIIAGSRSMPAFPSASIRLEALGIIVPQSCKLSVDGTADMVP